MDDRRMLSERVGAVLLDIKEAATALAVYSPKTSSVSATWGAIGNELNRTKQELLELLNKIRDEDEPLEASWLGFGRAHANVKSVTREPGPGSSGSLSPK